jgi:hypothetical protein
MPADSRPAGPGKPTTCQRLVGLTLAEPNRFSTVSNPMRHLVMTAAHLAVQIAAATALENQACHNAIHRDQALFLGGRD